MKMKKTTALIAAAILTVSALTVFSAARKDPQNTAAPTEIIEQTKAETQTEIIEQTEIEAQTEIETPTETAAQTKAAAKAETTAKAEAAEPAKSAAQTDAFRAVYARKLADLRAAYGTPQGDDPDQTNVVFADLFNWDADGKPELVVLIREDDTPYAEVFRVKIYGEKDGKAVTLLDENVGSTYGFLCSDLLLNMVKTKDGTLAVCVDDSHDYADLKETYYTLSEGKVRSTVLSAQSSVGGWVGEGADAYPVDPDAYQIDGKSCTKAEFDKRKEALTNNDFMSVICQREYDLRALDAYLSGKSDTYRGGALLQANDLLFEDTEWLPDVLFTV